MIKRWEVEIPALTGEQKRKAYVYLPAGYGCDKERRFPVIYMFDGHNLFYDSEATYGKCWGLKEYLDNTQTQVIIAAVECNKQGNERLSEYSPVDFEMRGVKIKGSGKKYMDWLVNTFKPYIDKNFRTLSDRQNTAIAGSSMGGLMTVYALSKYNKFFSRGAALSPSLWVEGGAVPLFVQKGRYGKDTVLYTDYGSREFKNHDCQKKAFSEMVSHLIRCGVNVTARVVYGGTHSEASWEKEIPFFMRALGLLPEKQ